MLHMLIKCYFSLCLFFLWCGCGNIRTGFLLPFYLHFIDISGQFHCIWKKKTFQHYWFIFLNHTCFETLLSLRDGGPLILFMKNKHIILCALEFLICSCYKNYYQVVKVIESIKNLKENNYYYNKIDIAQLIKFNITLLGNTTIQH